METASFAERQNSAAESATAGFATAWASATAIPAAAMILLTSVIGRSEPWAAILPRTAKN
jgi:hypothetical protein